MMSNCNLTPVSRPKPFGRSENSGTDRGSPATTLYMHRYLPLCLLLCAPIATSCFQTLDDAASSQEPVAPEPPTPEDWPTTHILPGPLPFGFFNSQGVLVDSEDPCDATRQQALVVLTKNCGGCHAGGMNQGDFNFLLDLTKLTMTYSKITTPPILFVAPGDPAHSRIYLRAWKKEMPPKDVPGQPNYPRPTVSDVSVLHNWITSCL